MVVDPRDDARPAAEHAPHPADDHAPDREPDPGADRETSGGGHPGAAEDAAWVEAARAGDELAFGRLFTRWFDPVYDLAWRIVRNPDTAAEVAQDVFLVAWRSLDDLEQPGSFGGWVRRIARNRALNRLDRERRSVPDDEQAAAALDRSAAAVDLSAGLEERDQRELVWAAASALGERDASVLDLHLRHGLGAGEIAEELGVTTNNAHQLLFRLKGKLGSAITAWVLWRGGRECAQLDEVIAAAGVTTFGADAVRAIGRHAKSCTDCTGRQQLRLAPEALFAAMPMAVAPPALKAEAAAALGEAGVPMAGAADVGGDASDGAGGEAAGPGDSAADEVSAGDAGAGEAAGTGDSAGDEVSAGDAGAGDSAGDEVSAGDAGAGDSAGDEVSAVEHGGGPDESSAPSAFPRRALAGVSLVVVLAVLAVLGLATVLAGGNDDGDLTETAATATTPSSDDADPDPSPRPRETKLEPVPTPSPAPPDADAAPPTTDPTVVDTTPVPDVPRTTAPTASGDPVPPPPAPEEPEAPPAPSPPTIGGFRASLGAPCGSSAVEQFVVLSWNSAGADSATISGPGGTSSQPASGTEARCLSSPAGSSFTLTVTGPGGSVERTATVS